MDTKEKKLIENLVSTFLILLSTCLLIALLIILKFKESCPEVIVGMLGVCATLYAPVAAFFFYDSWKEQKRYELIKEILDVVVLSIGQSYYEIIQVNVRFHHIYSSINDNLVICKNINQIIPNSKNELFQSIYSQLDRYYYLTKDKKMTIFFREYENAYLLLVKLNKKLTKIYNRYYNLIPEDIIDSLDSDMSDTDYLCTQRNIFNNDIIIFIEEYERINTVRYRGERTGFDQIEIDMNYRQVDDHLKRMHKELLILITEILDIK